MTTSRELDEIRGAAAAWVVALQNPEITDESLVAFDAWLDARPDHRSVYEEALDTWVQSSELTSRGMPAATRPMVARRARRRERHGRRWFAVSAAAAGLLAAVAGLGWFSKLSTPRESAVYATGLGERRDLVLSDNTRLALNAATRVVVDFQPGARRLRVDSGEVAVSVAHAPGRPFSVEAQGLQIRDVGTEFDVRARGDGVTVTVAKGMVEVGKPNGGPPIRLAAGQQLVRPAAGEASRVETVPTGEGFGWERGELVLRNEPLDAVVTELNNYFREPIRLADPALAKRRVSGVLRLSDEATTLRTLSLFTPMRVTHSAGAVLLAPGATTP